MFFIETKISRYSVSKHGISLSHLERKTSVTIIDNPNQTMVYKIKQEGNHEKEVHERDTHTHDDETLYTNNHAHSHTAVQCVACDAVARWRWRWPKVRGWLLLAAFTRVACLGGEAALCAIRSALFLKQGEMCATASRALGAGSGLFWVCSFIRTLLVRRRGG